MDEIGAHSMPASYRLAPSAPVVRFQGSGGRSCTIRCLGPGDCRAGVPDATGAVGSWSPLAVGASASCPVGGALVVELLGDSVADCVLALSSP